MHFTRCHQTAASTSLICLNVTEIVKLNQILKVHLKYAEEGVSVRFGSKYISNRSHCEAETTQENKRKMLLCSVWAELFWDSYLSPRRQ